MAVEDAGEYLTVAIRDSAVDDIAACNGRCVRIARRFKLPHDVPYVVEINGVDIVRIGTLEVHHVADNQRLALMATQGSRRHRPRDPQILGVLRIDLVEFAVAGETVIAARHHPLIRIVRHLLELFVGLCSGRKYEQARYRQNNDPPVVP